MAKVEYAIQNFREKNMETLQPKQKDVLLCAAALGGVGRQGALQTGPVNCTCSTRGQTSREMPALIGGVSGVSGRLPARGSRSPDRSPPEADASTQGRTVRSSLAERAEQGTLSGRVRGDPAAERGRSPRSASGSHGGHHCSATNLEDLTLSYRTEYFSRTRNLWLS